MQVVSASPIPVGSLLWQPRAGAWALTVVCKATYALAPGACRLADLQDPIREDEAHRSDDPTRSVYAPSDLVPWKPRADVLLVGHAFAPTKTPVRSITTRIAVGEVDKAIEVWCDRVFRADGQMLEGAPFTRMSLAYERAAGGADTSNPVGMSFDALPDKYGAIPVPNLQPPGLRVAHIGDTFAPLGYGPIASRWRTRTQKLHRHEATFSRQSLKQPLPDDFDPSYWCAAPPGQQTSFLQSSEPFTLENLHPQHARLVTSLPGHRIQGLVERASGAREDVKWVIDTLWIDTDRGICVVTWRGQVSLVHADEAGRVVVSFDPAASSIAQSLLDRLASYDDGAMATMTIPASAPRAVSSVMPFAAPSSSVKPPLAHAPPPPVPAPVPASVPAPVSVPAPARVPAPVPASVPAPVSVPAPASVSVSVPVSVPVPASAPVLPPPMDEAAAERGWKPAPSAPVAVKGAAAVGVLAASNAAAANEVPAPASAPPISAPSPSVRRQQSPAHAPIVELLWLDPAVAPRARKQPAWKAIIEQIKPAPHDDDYPDAAPMEKRKEAKDRRDMFGLLARGSATGMAGVDEALRGAVRDDGSFVPPLLLVAGELHFPFDELKTLKATIAAVAPLIAGDKRLKEAVDTTNELLQTPWIAGSSGVTEGLTAKLKDVFAQGNRLLPPGYLETHTQRILLEQRAYQKRTVLGSQCLRALLHLSGSPSPIPVYLPGSLAEELPSYPSFSARLLAEARFQLDSMETHLSALRALALGRVITLKGV